MIYEPGSRVVVRLGPHTFPATVKGRTYERVPRYQVLLDCGAYITEGVHIERALREGEGERIVLGDEIGSAA